MTSFSGGAVLLGRTRAAPVERAKRLRVGIPALAGAAVDRVRRRPVERAERAGAERVVVVEARPDRASTRGRAGSAATVVS